jgi:hypothetical protein
MKEFLAAAFLLAAPVGAAVPRGAVDDSDLSDPVLSAADARRLSAEGRRTPEGLVFKARSEKGGGWEPADRIVKGKFLLFDRAGARHPARLACAELLGEGNLRVCEDLADDGSFQLKFPPAPKGGYRVRLDLDNNFWHFENPSGGKYVWDTVAFEAPQEGGIDLGILSPEPGSAAGKLGVLHLTYVEALDYLKAQGNLSWWKKSLTVNWPGSADFFSPWAWSLDLTNALAWDVVLHELGHAVMHGAFKAASAGGQHKIDECYSAALAWSEGWGTFFAAAVRLSPADPDARFEFLVPRRAPIRLENVPEDVCRGETNEWRVAAGLWDLHDVHDDGGDAVSLGFAPLWKGFTGGRTSSLSTAWELVSKDLNPVARRAGQAALAHNSLLPAPAEIAARVPEPPAGWAAPR